MKFKVKCIHWMGDMFTAGGYYETIIKDDIWVRVKDNHGNWKRWDRESDIYTHNFKIMCPFCNPQPKGEKKMGRFYKHEGKELPSVTTVCSALDKSTPLMHWSVNCACDFILDRMKDPELVANKEDMYPIIEKARKEFKNVSSKAMDIGSVVHKVIENYLKTGHEPKAPSVEVMNAFDAFLEWKEEYHVEPIKTEQTVYHERYAGTLDLYCIMTIDVADLKYIVDFKAAKGIYEDHRFQVAAYRNAFDGKVDGCGILRLDKVTGMPQWKDTSATYEQDLKVFMALLKLWYARHPKHKI